MGLLIDGLPLSWPETRRRRDHVHAQATAYILDVYSRHKDRFGDPYLWGDEVEYQVVNLNTAQLSLSAHQVLESLIHSSPTQWHPEYARWMLESTPIQPYTDSLFSFARGCEFSMAQRRREATLLLKKDEHLFSFAAFPALGIPFCLLGENHEEIPMHTPHSHSTLLPDAAISSHPRFATITSNIRLRRGDRPVAIHVPLFAASTSVYQDTSLSQAMPQNTTHVENGSEKIKEMLILDAMGFGMGLCSLQTTIQCPSLDAAKRLYDRLAVVAPILLALTASTPALCSRLLDVDARWDIIAASVDDRSPEEMLVVGKSRYSTISTFLSTTSSVLNDTSLPINVRMYDTLVRSGSMDPALARHFSHLFVRDPLVLYATDDSNPSSNDEESLFECIQSTNWNTVRLKLPSDSLHTHSWRVEFRPMEAQITDFESSAFVVFVQLIARAILESKDDIVSLIPISLLDENMSRAQQRDAVRNSLFHWAQDEQVLELSIQEITNQLLDIAYATLYKEKLRSNETQDAELLVASIERYLVFIKGRASGTIPTLAHAIRNFVLAHPSYASDGVIPKDTLHELLKRLALHSELNIPVLHAL